MPIQTYPNEIQANQDALDALQLYLRNADTQISQDYSASFTPPSAPTGFQKMNGCLIRDNFPIGGPLYYSHDPGITITPAMHFKSSLGKIYQATMDPLVDTAHVLSVDDIHNASTELFFSPQGKRTLAEFLLLKRIPRTWEYAIKKEAHTTSDSDYNPIIYTDSNTYPIEYVPGTDHPLGMWNLEYRRCHLYQFRAAVTYVNPEKDTDKQRIMEQGLESSDKLRNGITSANYLGQFQRLNRETVVRDSLELNASPETPTSPLHPFTRMYADRAHNAIVTSYNRTRIPVADIEHRKAFRYIFITRPECYLMAIGDKPSYQVLNDDDMATCWMRFPHVIRALSPVYITKSQTAPRYANWNWLLCNRVQGMSTGANTLNLVDSTTKGVRGATVTMGKNLGTNLGGTLEMSFMDTKYMDVYEMLRIWMLYIHKRRMGSFYPSFNGYQQSNGFYTDGASVYQPGGYSTLHPYDRALDYCASVYDIVTNESGTKILYWCKYYGVFPVNLSNPMLSNDSNAPLLTQPKLSASFQYQYKQENIFKNLVEFNFNAGICDSVGNMREDIEPYMRRSVPFLYRENGKGGTLYTNPNLNNYVGAASMFTGSPYIITERSGAVDPWEWTSEMRGKQIEANLCFVPIFYGQPELNDSMNLGISNEIIPNKELREIMVLQSGM